MFHRRRVHLHCLLLAACQSVTTQTIAASATSSPFRRCAVIADEAVRRTGVSDLVTSELLAGEKLQLVEREQLDSVLQEIELSQLHRAAHAYERTQTGRLLKADALILISQGKHQQTQFLRVVICDCQSGARLSSEQFEYSTDETASLAVRVGAFVLDTLRRFPRGVENLVTVSPFLSKNFTHQHDGLQNACSAWLSETLTRQSGLAVLELKEARAIYQEQALTGERGANIRRPLFIEGEFATALEDDSPHPTTQLSIIARDGESVVLTLKSESLRHDKLSDWLEKEAGHAILEKLDVESKATSRLPRDEQFRLLIERATRFSRFGSFEESVGLREAAILLRDDTAEELKLLRDYGDLLRLRAELARQSSIDRYHQTSAGTAESRQKSARTVGTRFQRDLYLYRARIAHCERLVRQPEIATRDHGELLRAVYSPRPELSSVTQGEYFATREAAFWSVVQALSRHSRRERKQASGRPGNPDRLKPVALMYSRWVGQAAQIIVQQRGLRPSRSGRMTWQSNDTLDAIRRLIESSLLENCPSRAIMQLLLSDRGQKLAQCISQGRISEQELEDFRRTLHKADSRVLNFYGRCLDSTLNWVAVKDHSTSAVATRLRELSQLEDWAAEWMQSHRETIAFSFPVRMTLKRAQLDLKRRLRTPATSRWPTTRKPFNGSQPWPHLWFEKLPVQADWARFTPATSDFDFVWSERSLARMEEPAAPTAIFEPPNESDVIRHVEWDGQHLWVGTRQFGIHVLTANGDVLAEFPQGTSTIRSANSLPAWNMDLMSGDTAPTRSMKPAPSHTFRLYPVSPGRCIVSGRQGEHRRRWTAAIQLDSGKWKIRVLHEATVVPGSAAPTSPAIDMIFEPKWTLPIPSADGQYPLRLLMGRGQVNSYRVDRSPILLDLKSNSAKVLEGPFPLHSKGPIRFPVPVGNRFVIPVPTGCQLVDATSPEPHNWTVTDIPFQEHFGNDRSLPIPLITGGSIVFPGRVWRRVDPKSGNVEVINQTPLASAWIFEEYAASRSQGWFAWNHGDDLYRIHLNSEMSKHPTGDQQYPFIPREYRRSHADAVALLRELGATVVTRWGYYQRSKRQDKRREWHTYVWLPESWKGGRAEFARLKDLYNLRRLAIVGAPVKDDWCPVIAGLKRLQQLTFEQTLVTDRGLDLIGALPELVEVRLQCRGAQQHFTNAAFEWTAAQPSLEILIVGGEQFTDDALSKLPPQPFFRELCLLDTSISEEATARLATQRTRLTVKRSIGNDPR